MVPSFLLYVVGVSLLCPTRLGGAKHYKWQAAEDVQLHKRSILLVQGMGEYQLSVSILNHILTEKIPISIYIHTLSASVVVVYTLFHGNFREWLDVNPLPSGWMYMWLYQNWYSQLYWTLFYYFTEHTQTKTY